MIFVDNFIAPELCENWAAKLADAPFQDGKVNIGRYSKLIKNNEQLEKDPLRDEIQATVLKAMFSTPRVAALLRPKNMSWLRISRYTAGMAYGAHVDNASISSWQGKNAPPIRSDIAFTLFLRDANSYDGGELCLTTQAGEEEIKLDAGQAVFYDANTIHEVREVTGGERLVVVGWLQSHVQDPLKRELLADVERINTLLFDKDPTSEEHLLTIKLASALNRMWREF